MSLRTVTPGVGPTAARLRPVASLRELDSLRNSLMMDDLPTLGTPTTMATVPAVRLNCAPPCSLHQSSTLCTRRPRATDANTQGAPHCVSTRRCRLAFARSLLLNTTSRGLPCPKPRSSSGLAELQGTRASRTSISTSTASSCAAICRRATAMCPGNQLTLAGNGNAFRKALMLVRRTEMEVTTIGSFSANQTSF